VLFFSSPAISPSFSSQSAAIVSSYADRDAEPVGHSAFRLSAGLPAQVSDSIEGFVF